MPCWVKSIIPLLLSALFLAVVQLSRPPANLKPKVFVIGLSKTGTTSVGNALALLGYKRIGWKDIRSPHLVHNFIHGNIGPMIEQTKHFDAFEDLPWPFVYQEMAERFPDAKFVLTLRKDEQTWLRSMDHHQSRGAWAPAIVFYGTQDIKREGEMAASAYRNHTAKVRRYFRDKPDRYVELIIDNDSDRNWAALCRVAQCPSGPRPITNFPRSNTLAHWRDGSFVATLHGVWGTIISSIETTSSRLYFGNDRRPLIRSSLEQVWKVVSMIELACSNLYFKIAVQGQRSALI